MSPMTSVRRERDDNVVVQILAAKLEPMPAEGVLYNMTPTTRKK